MESGPGDLPAALTVGWLCQSFSVVVRSSDRRRSFRQGVLLQFGLSRPGLRRLSDCLIRSGPVRLPCWLTVWRRVWRMLGRAVRDCREVWGLVLFRPHARHHRNFRNCQLSAVRPDERCRLAGREIERRSLL